MEKEQFAQMVMTAEPTLFHIAFSILHNEQDCADAVQEAVLKAYEGREKLKKTEYFKTWIVRIVINECYLFLRRQKKQAPFEEQRQYEDPELFVKEEYLDLYNAIDSLADKEKICVQLHYLEGYSVKEIERILKCPAGTVKTRLRRARIQLGGILKGELQ